MPATVFSSLPVPSIMIPAPLGALGWTRPSGSSASPTVLPVLPEAMRMALVPMSPTTVPRTRLWSEPFSMRMPSPGSLKILFWELLGVGAHRTRG